MCDTVKFFLLLLLLLGNVKHGEEAGGTVQQCGMTCAFVKQKQEGKRECPEFTDDMKGLLVVFWSELSLLYEFKVRVQGVQYNVCLVCQCSFVYTYEPYTYYICHMSENCTTDFAHALHLCILG